MARRAVVDIVGTIACSLLALASLSMCLAIEVQNRRAGNYLPRRSPTDLGKWRVEAFPDESPRERERGRLRGFVVSCGLPQYLMLPTLVIGSVLMAVRGWPRRSRTRWVSGACLAAAATCAALVRHREYFTSLGG